eukprot:1776930-Amphidinium_carterae.1
MNFSKASADIVHAENIGTVRQDAAKVIAAVATEVLRTGKVPACWRGAEICVVPKPRDPIACRPIALRVNSQRIFTRVLLGRLREVLTIAPNQLALSPLGGCDQAQLKYDIQCRRMGEYTQYGSFASPC